MRNKRGKFTRVPSEVSVEKLTPLDITCGSTKCESRLHCFSLKKSSIKKFGKKGVCRECGTDLIDWRRIHKRDINDADFIFNSMKNELIRHVFWHTEIDDNAISTAKEEGRDKLLTRTKKVLRSRVLKNNSYWDGRQTPMGNGDIINYAQHATATCCRKCIEIWHNIPPEEILSDKQLDFFSELVMLYAEEKIPEIINNE